MANLKQWIMEDISGVYTCVVEGGKIDKILDLVTLPNCDGSESDSLISYLCREKGSASILLQSFSVKFSLVSIEADLSGP